MRLMNKFLTTVILVNFSNNFKLTDHAIPPPGVRRNLNMTLRTLSSIILTATILGCNSNSNHQPLNDTMKNVNDSGNLQPTLTNDTTKYTSNEYAFIVRNIQKGDSAFIDADYIQYLTGQSAIDAAVKKHQADTFQTEDGKIHVDIPDDYFIVNDNKKIRRLLLDKNCSIELVINPDGIPPIVDNSLQSLKKVDNESPFLLTLNEKGVVIKIKEIFVP